MKDTMTLAEVTYLIKLLESAEESQEKHSLLSKFRLRQSMLQENYNLLFKGPYRPSSDL